MAVATNNVQLNPRVLGSVLALAGVLFVGIAVVIGVSTREFISNAQGGEATVVSLHAGSAHPKLEFVRADGKTLEFYGSGWISHRVGDRVPVLYEANGTPSSIELDEPSTLWFLPGMFGALGSVAFLVGLYVSLRH